MKEGCWLEHGAIYDYLWLKRSQLLIATWFGLSSLQVKEVGAGLRYLLFSTLSRKSLHSQL